MLPQHIFVLGGAASGKSLWAEKLLESSDLNLIYLATGQIFDAEIKSRVKVHKDRRSARWHTVEAPFDLPPVLQRLGAQDGVLIDCATMWLSNHLLAEHDIQKVQATWLDALAATPATCVVVSNEVGHGIVPDNALARRFREAQGRLNIALAAQAQLAVQVTAGLPLALKGQLP